MKKLWILTAAMLSLAVPMQVYAEGEEEIPPAEEAVPAEAAPAEAVPEEEVPTEEVLYRYELDMEGNAELLDFLPAETYEGEVIIPTEIDGHPVDYVGNACFMNAAGVTSITIPASLTDMGKSVFFGCTSLEAIHVEAGNPYYTEKDGVLLADSEGYLVAYPAAKEGDTYAIPETVDEIAPGAFGFAQYLKEITIPDSVISIDSWCFAYSALETINTGAGLVQIDDYAFAYCDALHTVNLSSGITIISNAVFAHDAAITQITIPDTVTYIGQYAFCGTGLTCVTIPNSVQEISYCAFGYDANMAAIEDFTIYGEPYSAGQTYATSVDTENDYENHFTFVAVADGSVPYELGEGELYEARSDAAEAAETDENGDVIVIETDAEGNPVNPTEDLGAGLKDNHKLQMMLGIGGGVAVLLAVILIAAFAKKPKKKADAPEESNTAETNAEPEKDEET